MSIKWDGPIDKRRVELLEEGLTYAQVASILTREFKIFINSKSVENRCFRTNTLKHQLSNIGVTPMLTHQNEEDLFPSECYDNENEFCMIPQKVAKLKELHTTLTEMKPKKILSLSDLHAPNIDFAAVEEAVKNNLDADMCLLNGDVFDGQALSSFDKMKEFDIEVELNQVFQLLDVLTEKFAYVVWVGGNHDMARFNKFVMKNFGPSMRDFVMKRLNPMDYIAEKYDNLIIVPHDWVQIGDVLFAHLHNFSSVEMKTVVTVNDIFNALRLSLPEPNYRALIIGHTHHMGWLIKNGVLLAEQGCLCFDMDYRFNKPTKIRWETGYAIIEFDDNMKAKFNDTKIIHINR